MNKAFLIGRLVKDPELRYTDNNKSVSNFTIAINRITTAGEQKADFINIVSWGNQAENCKKYLTKGSQVAVEGRINTRTYEEKDGNKKFITEIMAERVQFLETKKQEEEKTTPYAFEKNDEFEEFGNSIDSDFLD